MMEFLPQIALGATIISAVWGHAIWLSTRFDSIQKGMDFRMENILNKITDKLEYHERHDDQRFGHIGDAIWEVRLQQALGNRFGTPKKSTTGIGGEEVSSGI